MKSVFQYFALIFSIIILSCGGSDSNPTGSGPYSWTVIDPSFSGADPKYISAIFNNNVPQTDISVSTAQNLTNGNSITFSGLQGSTSYYIFAWIDSDGDGKYGDDNKGYVTFIEEINADFELETAGLFSDFEDMQINITGGSTLNNKTVRCFWLLAGTLNESVKDLLGGNQQQRSSVTTLVGSVTEALNGDDPFLTVIGINDLPVPANPLVDFLEIKYDCYCIVDVDNSETRNSDDYQGEEYSIAGDGSVTPINLTAIP